MLGLSDVEARQILSGHVTDKIRDLPSDLNGSSGLWYWPAHEYADSPSTSVENFLPKHGKYGSHRVDGLLKLFRRMMFGVFFLGFAVVIRGSFASCLLLHVGSDSFFYLVRLVSPHPSRDRLDEGEVCSTREFLGATFIRDDRCDLFIVVQRGVHLHFS